MTDYDKIRAALLSAGDKMRALANAVRRVPVTNANTQALLEVSVFHAQAHAYIVDALLIATEMRPRGKLLDLGMRRKPAVPFDVAIGLVADGEGPEHAG